MHRGRVFFAASVNPFGENPGEICQRFTTNLRGGDLRQVTHLPWDGRPSDGCNYTGGACRIDHGIADLVGSVDGLPADLGARRRHYLTATGYGQKRAR